jgi:DNA-directed RNA polymerase subunit RPC12/RpoP
MTKDEALRRALEALEDERYVSRYSHISEAITAIKEALAQPVQEPVAWADKQSLDQIANFDATIYAKGGFDNATPLYTTPSLPEQEPTCPECKAKVLYECVACSSNNYPPLPEQERNFCPRCGKRTADLTTIHTCTPPQEALYGMNQDDWKDVVAAISKVRDGRGIYLACRPADVFKDWFLALGTAKVKEKK